MRFEEYLSFPEQNALHPLPRIPKHLKKFENLILYGPSGSGKYTLALRILATYSKTRLKYEKRVNVPTSTGSEVLVKVSDVHYEVDAEILGCNARTNFHEVFGHVKEMIDAKFPEKEGIILCTNFHLVHPELLEIFYSFMQPGIKFILLTEAVAFLPPSMSKRCRIVAVPKPQPAKVCAAFGLTKEVSSWSNLKDVLRNDEVKPRVSSAEEFASSLVAYLGSPLRVSDLREDIYSVLVNNENIEDVFWRMCRALLPLVPSAKMSKLISQIVFCMQCHSCNYRPIFHLEFFVYSLFDAISSVKK